MALTRELLFLFLIIVAWTVLLLFGESLIEPAITGLLSLLFLAYFFTSHNYNRFHLSQTSWFLLFWLGTTLFSSYFSHNLPLSLQAVMTVLFSVAAYHFGFLFSKNTDTSVKSFLFIGLIMTGVILVILSFLLQFIPEAAISLPGKNLLFASYGHNHLGGYLLLILPISWFFALTKQKPIAWLSTLILSIGLVLSFGRGAIAIGIIQVVAIYFYFLSKEKRKLLNKQIVVLGSLLISILCSFIFFSFVVSPEKCPVPQLQQRLCKPLSNEYRLKYWSQAMSAIREYPLVGYGPGTYHLVSLRYRATPTEATAHAHNEILEQSAEKGIMGGIAWIGLMIWMITQALLSFRSDSKTLRPFLGLAVVSLLVDSLFDFNLSFVGINSSLFLLFGYMVGSTDRSELKRRNRGQISKLLYVSVALIVAIIGVIYTISSITLRKNFSCFGRGLALLFFENFHFGLYSDSLNDSDKEALINLYKYHPLVYELKVNSEIAILEEIDPWLYLSFDHESVANSFGQDEADRITLNQGRVIVRYFDVLTDPSVYPYQQRIVFELLNMADRYYHLGKYQESGELYALGQRIYPWALGNRPPPFEGQVTSIDNLESFIYPLNTVSTDFMVSPYTEAYADAYLTLFRHYLAEKEWAKGIDTAKRISSFAPWKMAEVRAVLMSDARFLSKTVPHTTAETALTEIDKVYLIWRAVEEGADEHDRQAMAQLMVVGGNLSVNQSDVSFVEYYQKAHTLYPTIFATTPLWIEKVSLAEVDSVILTRYANEVGLLASLIPTKDVEHQKVLQMAANRSIQNHDYAQAEQYLAQLRDAFPDGYWNQVQVAHFCVWLRDQGNGCHIEPQQLFEACLRRWRKHEECEQGLKHEKESTPNAARYHQVAQIIMGEKQWQDFN